MDHSGASRQTNLLKQSDEQRTTPYKKQILTIINAREIKPTRQSIYRRIEKLFQESTV